MGACAALLAAAAVLVAGAALCLGRRYRRYAVSGASMLPALRPGDWVIVDREAYRVADARGGEIALALDPRDARRTLVKRVAGLDGAGAVRLLGDHAAASTDSRTLGAFPPALLLGRVRWRYWPPPLGRVR